MSVHENQILEEELELAQDALQSLKTDIRWQGGIATEWQRSKEIFYTNRVEYLTNLLNAEG